MEKMMARFGDEYTKTQVISENNSIKYKLSFAVGSEFSTPSSGYFTFQDEPIGDQQDGVGINVRVYNPALNTIYDKKTFLLTENDTDAGNQAFLSYLDSFTEDNKSLLIFTTSGNFKSSSSVENKFKSMFSTMWPSIWMTKNYYCTYCALVSISEKRIIAENVTYSDGILRDEDIRPALEFVYDKADDIGATGYSFRAIEDFNEYVSSDVTIKRYPVNDVYGVTLESIGLKENDNLFWSFDYFHGEDLVSSGRNIRISLRWLKADNSVLSTVSVDSNPLMAGNWIHHERNTTVPIGAVKLTVVASKTSGTDNTGSGGVRSMILSKVSRKLESMNSPAAISVNGIRMNNAVSGTNPELLILPVLEVDENGVPLPGEDVSGNIYSSDWREFEKDI